jgi:hypothetical protein
MDPYFIILIILSLILYLIILFCNKVIFYRKRENSTIKYPIWVYLLVLLSCLIPILNLSLAILLTIIYFADVSSEDDIILNPNIKNWKIVLFLTKKI